MKKGHIVRKVAFNEEVRVQGKVWGNDILVLWTYNITVSFGEILAIFDKICNCITCRN